MCGICGWIDFERDLTSQQAVLQEMTDTLTHRGPDAEGTWTSPRAAVGDRRLAVIDVVGGIQPMVHHDPPRGDVVLVYSGEVYNFRELRAELERTGERFTTSSDTEVVLRGYVRWGQAIVHRLNGMYAFAIWDGRTEELLLVRDRLGIKPLFYYPLREGVLFGSEPKAILASGQVDAVVDETGVLELFALVRTPGQAIYRGLREVRPGHTVRVRRAGLAEHAYWTLTATEHTQDLDQTIRTTRELLDDIVARQLIADVPLCALLSGGLDSSTITALAQSMLRAQGIGPLRSFMVDFGGAEAFHPDPMRGTRDAPFVHELVEHVGTDHTDIVIDTEELLSQHAWDATLKARDLPALGEMDTSLYLMCKAVRAHSTVALSGEAADELFGGYRWFHDAEVIASDTFPWLAMAGKLGRQSIFEPRLVGRLNVAAYQADRYAEALAEVPRLPGEAGLERRMREISYLHLTRFLPTPIDRKDRMSMAVGLEMRVPFCDHRLVEYVFNVPWAMKSFDGREKSLLRAAARELLPDAVAQRTKSAFPSTQDPSYHALVRDRVTRLLADRHAPVFELLSHPAVRALAAMPAHGIQVVRMSLERVLRVNDWLERYHVRVEV
jgi:asparagine synthase (glutamine-hydrolysing)